MFFHFYFQAQEVSVRLKEEQIAKLEAILKIHVEQGFSLFLFTGFCIHSIQVLDKLYINESIEFQKMVRPSNEMNTKMIKA